MSTAHRLGTVAVAVLGLSWFADGLSGLLGWLVALQYEEFRTRFGLMTLTMWATHLAIGATIYRFRSAITSRLLAPIPTESADDTSSSVELHQVMLVAFGLFLIVTSAPKCARAAYEAVSPEVMRGASSSDWLPDAGRTVLGCTLILVRVRLAPWALASRATS